MSNPWAWLVSHQDDLHAATRQIAIWAREPVAFTLVFFLCFRARILDIDTPFGRVTRRTEYLFAALVAVGILNRQVAYGFGMEAALAIQAVMLWYVARSTFAMVQRNGGIRAMWRRRSFLRWPRHSAQHDATEEPHKARGG